MTLYEGNSWNSVFQLDQLDFNEIFFGKSPDINELIPEEHQALTSIHWDCQRIESSLGGSSLSEASSELSENEIFIKSETPNYSNELRNYDCMWSGINNLTKKSSFHQKNQLHKNNNSNISNSNINSIVIKEEIIDPEEQILLRQNELLIKQNQNIPPGASLLLNSRINAQRKKQQQIINFTIPSMTTVDFLKDRETITIARPDTPLSSDDDPHEFKHTVDLAACVTGSNNISLEGENDKIIINKLKEQLEDTTTKNFDIRQIISMPGHKNRSLSEVLNVIETDNLMPVPIKVEPDDDDDDDEDEVDGEDEDSEIDDLVDTIPTNMRDIFSSSESVTHDDHCYTRSTSGVIDVVGIGLETPSDSDEEIDVVSIGDKKLPNNPSDKDRRALQTKVANKISAGTVKRVNGIRTIASRRRCSYEPYTAPATPVKSSFYSTPVSTPYSYHSSSASTASTPNNNVNNISINNINNNRLLTNSRKRAAPSNNKDENQQQYLTSNNSKKSRTKKQKTTNRKYHTIDEVETIVKRNLHNDMERQRRIGLKNLFEALKKHIPSIRDKDRAPKVNILREAAKYCEQIAREEKLLLAHKQQLQIQQQKKLAEIQLLQMSVGM